MYDRLTLKETGSVPSFIQAIVHRCSGHAHEDFFRRFSVGIITASGLPTSERTRNQCMYVAGEKRWCSDLLTDLASYITGSSRLHCHAAGAENMGFDRRDIRAIHAAAIRTIMDVMLYRQRITRRTAHVGSIRTSAIYECYNQFQDYLENKVRSRDKVREAIEGYSLIPAQFRKPSLNFVVQAENAALINGDSGISEPILTTNQPKGNDNMSLGVQVSPQPAVQSFNFTKPAIEDIKFVFGVSVKDLSLSRLTELLTNRQVEVDRLKALPHKPEVIKARIIEAKAEIKQLLALTNELFPVAK